MSLPMFYGAMPATFKKARELRAHTTSAEKCLWEKIKENKLLNCRFKRQHPVANYIVDFYCHKAKLVIEIDVESHDRQIEYDNNRTEVMNAFGLKVIRFKNEDVINRVDLVVSDIELELRSIFNQK